MTAAERLLLLLAVLGGVLLPSAHRTEAQTLARPGWRGSGMSTDPWWASAVFYRIAPAHFQDSDGDGIGDLGGIAQRMDYLQSLGVDAVVLQLPFEENGFDDLLTEASRHHIRLVVGLDGQAGPDGAAGPVGTDRQHAQTGAAAMMAQARRWLAQGAAGVLLPDAAAGTLQGGEPELRRALRQLAGSFPGERILITRPPAPAAGPALRPEAGVEDPGSSAPASASRSSASRALTVRPARRLRGSVRRGQATMAVPLAPERSEGREIFLRTLPLQAGSGDTPTPASLAAILLALPPFEGAPLLLQAEGRPASSRTGVPPAARNPAGPHPEILGTLAAGRGVATVAAAVLLTQRSAVLLEYGQELGDARPGRMPWTPSNITPVITEAQPADGAMAAPGTASGAGTSAPSAASPEVYGPYKPYVPPPPASAARPKAPAPGEVDLPAPDSLPGFSTRGAERGGMGEPGAGLPDPLASAASEASVASPFAPVLSVALQDRDPRSLLHLYRALLALHHGNATLRNGSLALLHSGEGTVVWLRRAPAGARTVASVVVAVNCGAAPVALSLRSDFARLRLHPGSLRPLLATEDRSEPQSSERLTLAPGEVFVGELIH